MLAQAVPAAGLDRQRLAELMVRYQRGDQAAAAELVRLVSPSLLRFLAGPLATRPFAEDLLQECWLRIHAARHTHRPGEPVLAWMFAIARHTRIDGYRRRRRIDAHELAHEAARQWPQPGAGPPDIDLPRLINSLPAGQREVIVMLKVAGLTLEEVACATSSTVGAVKQKAHRAYEKLRAALNGGERARP